jgi:hypothetical protein
MAIMFSSSSVIRDFDLERRSGEVSNIIAKEVCKNDEFTVDSSQETPIVHKPQLDGDRGEITTSGLWRGSKIVVFIGTI